MKKIGTGVKSPRALQAAPELIEIQALMPIDPADKERLRADIQESGEIRDALKVYRDRRSGDLLILGGYNRWQIALELELSSVPVDEYEGTPAQRRDLVIKDNLNRRHLTAEQKRDLIRYFLKQDPAQSNKAIAHKTGTTKETVKAQRAKLETGGEIRPLGKVTGRDGKQYTKPAKTPARKAEKPAKVDAAILDAKARDYLDKYISRYQGRDRVKAITRLIKHLETALKRAERAN
jgi:hypothetical protein